MAAMLTIHCPNCGERYYSRPENLGKSVQCRRCEQVFELKAPPGAVTPAQVIEAANRPNRPPSTNGPAPGAAGSTTGAAGGADGGGTAGAAHPIPVTDADFSIKVLQSPIPVLVDFWAPWCGPCRAIAPAIEELASEYAGRVTVAKLNTDENQRTSMQYGIQGIPCLLIFSGGQEIGRLVGARPKAAIKQALDRVAGLAA